MMREISQEQANLVHYFCIFCGLGTVTIFSIMMPKKKRKRRESQLPNQFQSIYTHITSSQPRHVMEVVDQHINIYIYIYRNKSAQKYHFELEGACAQTTKLIEHNKDTTTPPTRNGIECNV